MTLLLWNYWWGVWPAKNNIVASVHCLVLFLPSSNPQYLEMGNKQECVQQLFSSKYYKLSVHRNSTFQSCSTANRHSFLCSANFHKIVISWKKSMSFAGSMTHSIKKDERGRQLPSHLSVSLLVVWRLMQNEGEMRPSIFSQLWLTAVRKVVVRSSVV